MVHVGKCRYKYHGDFHPFRQILLEINLTISPGRGENTKYLNHHLAINTITTLPSFPDFQLESPWPTLQHGPPSIVINGVMGPHVNGIKWHYKIYKWVSLGFGSPLYMDLQAMAIYIYVYNCCLGPQLVHCCTVVPSLRQTQLLAHLGELQCPSCFNGDCAHVELRPSRVYTRSIRWEHDWIQLEQVLTAAGRTVNKMISWSTAKVRPPEETSQKLTTFSGWTIETKTNKETPTIKPNRAGYTVGNSKALPKVLPTRQDSVPEPTKLKGRAKGTTKDWTR